MVAADLDILEQKGRRDEEAGYVNRGIGMSDIPVRFLCRPEVTFITLAP